MNTREFAGTSSDGPLHPPTLLARAAAEAPESEGKPEYVHALHVLCDSIKRESKLNRAGRESAAAELVQCLITQARLRTHLHEHPEIRAIGITRPVFIIGFPRTGSTLLHNLLSFHPALRCPSFWELMTPAGPRDEHCQSEEATATQRMIDESRANAPQLKAIHFVGARHPDECHRLLCNTFQNHIYSLRFDVPSYAAWLDEQDLTAAYAHHRLALQSILWRKGGEVLVLKCPFHLWGLRSLVRTYPDARFIHLHRDPVTVVQSTASMCAALRSLRSDSLDRHQIAAYWLSRIERAAATVQKARHGAMAGLPFLDVAYDALKGDPIGVVQRIWHFIDVPSDTNALAEMQRFIIENPLQQHGVHRYTAEDFGLTPQDIQDRFASYRSEYGV